MTETTTTIPEAPDESVPPQYRFQMRGTHRDTSGYYHVNWEDAQKITVIAPTRDEAIKKAIACLGPVSRTSGWVWTFEFDSIEEVR